MKFEGELSNVKKRVGSRGPKGRSDQESIEDSKKKIKELTLVIDKAVKEHE